MDSVIYPEYIRLVEQVALDVKVHPDDWSYLQKHMSLDETTYLEQDEVRYSLVVDDKHPINWIEKDGKIFEVIGQNNRNKTTTLIYTATLLGFNWQNASSYINHQNTIEQAAIIQRLLSDGKVGASLVIENSKYQKTIRIVDGKAACAVWHKNPSDNIMVFSDLRIAGESDWAEYRSRLSVYSDVQYVGKGRYFIAQVGFEEAADLASFCRYIKTVIEHYGKMLMSHSSKKDKEAIEKQIEDLEKRIRGYISDVTIAKDDKSEKEIRLANIQRQLAELEYLLSDPELKQALSLKASLRLAEKAISQISALENSIKTLRNEVIEAQTLVEENDKIINQIEAISARLFDALESLKSEYPSGYLRDYLLDLVPTRDIDMLLRILPKLEANTNTVEAHKYASSNFSPPGVSLDTALFGVEVCGKSVASIASFKKCMAQAMRFAESLVPIQEDIADLKASLACLSLGSGTSFNSLKRTKEGIQAEILQKQRELTSLAKEKKEMQKALLTALNPHREIDSLQASASIAIGKVDKIKYTKLEQYLVDDFGVIDNERVDELQRQTEDLTEKIRKLEEKIEFCERNAERLSAELTQKEIEHENATDRRVIYNRVGALRELGQFLANVDEYIAEKKQVFESGERGKRTKLIEENRILLSDKFDEVIALINERIRIRCPFAFVNEDGVKRKEVKSYDFLAESFDVEGLSEGAKKHGGITSTMTVYGLATRKTGKPFGSILLVDEWGDVGVYKPYIYSALKEIRHLSLAIFVDINELAKETLFESR